MINPIKNLLGLEADKLVDSLAKAVDRFVTTKQEKEQLQLDLKRLVVQHREAEQRLQNEEMESARRREAQLGSHPGAWVMNGAAILAIAVFLGLVIALIYFPTPPENQRLTDLLTGSLSGIVIQLYQYWFGASLKR